MPNKKIPYRMKANGSDSVRMKCDGGINLFNAPFEIEDNQSADMLNMWYRGDALRLRPALIEKTVNKYGKILDIYPKNGSKLLLKRITNGSTVTEESFGIYIVTQSAILTYDGNTFFRVANIMNYENGEWTYYYNDYDFDNCVLLPAGESEYSSQIGTESLKASGSVIYLFGGGYFLAIGPYIITDGDNHYCADLLINNKIPYMPTLYVDTPPAGGGTRNESRNMLSGKVRQLFTTDGSSTVYRLCDSSLDEKTVTVDYDSITGSKTEFIFSPGQTSAVSDGIIATLSRTDGTITFSTALVKASSYSEKSNLGVTFYKTVYSDIPVCGCTIGEWFGDIHSDNGGNRIFLSGNQEYQDTIFFSAANDSTYFPEDAYVTAGDPSDPITAFGRHYDILVVFKKNSIYALDFDSSDVSVKLINASCGCDMPKSIQMVDNRLVWASSASGVYTLLSTQIKNERTAVLISKNINRKLTAMDYDTLETAVSLNTGSQYMLFAGKNVFVWDYSIAPFVKGSNINDSQKKLSWYLWELPYDVCCAMMISGTAYTADGDGTVYALDEQSTEDSAGWFDAWWYTKNLGLGRQAGLKMPVRCRAYYYSDAAASFEACYDDGTDDVLQTVFTHPTVTERPGVANIITPRDYTPQFRLGIRRAEVDGSDFGIACFDCEIIYSSVSGC